MTAVGAALSARARGLRLSLDDIAREAADLSQGRAGRVRIGAGPETAVSLLPAACAAMLKEAPGVALKITVATPDVVAPALSAGELDLGIMATRPTGYDDLVHEPLFEEAFVVLVSARHRLARKKRVALADLAQERWALGGRGAGGALSRVRAKRIAAARGCSGGDLQPVQVSTPAIDEFAGVRAAAIRPGQHTRLPPGGTSRKRTVSPAQHRRALPERHLPLPGRAAVHRDTQVNDQGNRKGPVRSKGRERGRSKKAPFAARRIG